MDDKTVQVSFRATEPCKKAIDNYMKNSGLNKSDAIRRLIEQGDRKVIIKDGKDIVQSLCRIETLLISGKADNDIKEQVRDTCGKLLNDLRKLIEGRDE